jgi:hypothetical protein
MKRGLALALLTLATSVVVNAQMRGARSSGIPRLPASINSPGTPGFARTYSTGRGGIGFGHHSGYITGSHNRPFHHRSVLVSPYYYWPYYGWNYGWSSFDAYDLSAYQQQPYVQPSQPIIVVVDPKASEDRYGDHSFEEARNSPPQAQPQAPPAPPQEQEPTLLVFRDGHKQEVRNYAIVGPMLWDFGAKGTHKIPLSDLDLDTTRKLNDERGVDFVLPKT